MTPFLLEGPATPESPIIANVPHSGTTVPRDVRRRLAPVSRCLPDTDWQVDRLFGFLPALGVSVLRATHNRCVIDLNRSLTGNRFGPIATSLIPATSFDGRPVHATEPSPAEVDERIERYYRPYHARLQSLIEERVDRFGVAYLLDLHAFDDVPTADVCLGDDEGRLGSERLMASLRSHLGARFHVVENDVWTGGHITLHYGRQPGVEAVQLETRHSLYLDSVQLERATSSDRTTPEPPASSGPTFAGARRGFESAFRDIVGELARGCEVHSVNEPSAPGGA